MMRTLGISVGQAQGGIDWLAVAASAVRFALVRATEGSTSTDQSFVRNWNDAKGAGILRGAYHQGRPGGDPETQAAHFAAVVDQGSPSELPPALCLNIADGHSPRHVLQWMEAFTRKVEFLLSQTLVISAGGFWRRQLGNPDIAFFRQRSLWLTAYGAPPVLPATWSEWTFWQYSDGTYNDPARIEGVHGAVSQSYFRGDEAALTLFCQGNRKSRRAPEPPSTSDPLAWPGVHFIWPLRPPVSGPAVRLFQTRLGAAGFPVQVDGVYGPESRVACQAFQRDLGLSDDGIVGPKTWDACVRSS